MYRAWWSWAEEPNRYITAGFLPHHWLYEWFSQIHSSGIYSVLSRSPSIVQAYVCGKQLANTALRLATVYTGSCLYTRRPAWCYFPSAGRINIHDKCYFQSAIQIFSNFLRIILTITVWLSGRVVRTLDLRSIGREFESWPLCYRVQPWGSC